MRRTTGLIAVSFTLVLACGDDGPPTSGGSGDGSSGAQGSSSSGIGATSLATTSDGSSSTDTSSSSGPLDGTSTGGEVLLCDVCTETDVCVLDFYEKNCIFCDDLQRLPLDVVCVPKAPAACDDALTHTRACTLALCGTPHANEYGCQCGEQGDFICGSNSQPQDCDYWDHREICGPEAKCAPARDEQYQPLPYTECIPPPMIEPLPAGAACMADSSSDPCEPTAYCDEVDPDTEMGTCRPLCVGMEAMPSCVDLGEICVLFFEEQPQFGGVCRPA